MYSIKTKSIENYLTLLILGLNHLFSFWVKVFSVIIQCVVLKGIYRAKGCARIIQQWVKVVLSVKTNFKNLLKETKNQFPHSNCLLLISVGQEAHEGDRLESTIQLINQSFSSCIILLYDSLQRHTMALSSYQSPEEFHAVANNEGEAWLRRNQCYLNQLAIPYKVSRWDTWISHPDYSKSITALKQTLSEDRAFNDIFNKTVNQYLERYQKRIIDNTNFNLARAEQICLDYLLEECAVLCLWPELRCEFEIYPNAHNQAMEATRAKYITPYFPHLLRSLNLRFRHAKQLKPQEFRLLNRDAVMATH